MSKLVVYLSILATILVGLNMLGLIPNTGTNALLSWLANPSDLLNSQFYTDINNLISLGAVVGVVIAGILSFTSEKGLLVGLTGLLLLIGNDIIQIYALVSLYIPYIALLIISPLLLVYFFSIVEWWRGLS